jgi:transcriptional regulator with XRE-family HTH domain
MSRETDRLLAALEARAAIREGRLRELRRRHGFSECELAAAVGVDPSALSRWETGARAPRLDAAARLGIVLQALESASPVLGRAQGSREGNHEPAYQR